MTESCNAAIIQAYKEGKITSTTLCANGTYLDEAINLIYKNNMEKNTGIHINITEGIPLTDEIRKDGFFCDKEGFLHGNINRSRPLSNKQKSLVYNEVAAQINKLRDAGITITHADSHHHIHTSFYITSAVIKALKDSNIQKIRICRNIGKITLIKKGAKWVYNKYMFMKKFITTDLFGSANDIENNKYIDYCRSLEIMVHPDYDIYNKLIDREKYDEYNMPVGKELHFPAELLNKFALLSYYYL